MILMPRALILLLIAAIFAGASAELAISLWLSLYPLMVKMTILVPFGTALSSLVVSPLTPAFVTWIGEPLARSMLSSTADHISFSATYPWAALWPSTTICAEATPVEERMMLASTSKKARTFEQVILAPLSPLSRHRGNFGGSNLKLAVALRIDQTVDPLRRGKREPHHHQLAGRRRQPMLRRLAMHMRAIGVGDDQAVLFGENLARQVLGEGEEQPVAMRPVIPPFLVGAQILDR